jgi:NADPH:quinone reductase
MPKQVQSTVTEDGRVVLSLADVEAPEPGAHQVVIRVEAAPINPSDLGAMFGPADLRTLRPAADGGGIEADVPEAARPFVAARVGHPLPMGNEGAGTVIAAGSSDDAQALLGRVVATWGGAMYAEQRVADVDQCLVLPEGVSARDGASAFVNPLTALGMVDTMQLEGHTALVHTAAASNLGQMLVKLCADEGIPLVNVVRRPEQVELLRDLGATHVCDSSRDDFDRTLAEAVAETDATVAFDATGGGTYADQILQAMEAAQARKEGSVGRYGSSTHKQVYVYGGLDRSPTVLRRTYGMAWGVGGWLLPYFLQRVGPERAEELRQRVADGITTTFASRYTATVSLEEALTADAASAYARQATGQKYLITPAG